MCRQTRGALAHAEQSEAGRVGGGKVDARAVVLHDQANVVVGDLQAGQHMVRRGVAQGVGEGLFAYPQQLVGNGDGDIGGLALDAEAGGGRA